MKRFHIHIAVDNLPQNIQYYSSLFAADPVVTKADYAKWMLDDPRINFAISQRGTPSGINHLGIQVDSADELTELHGRLQKLRSSVIEQNEAACCYAKSDKYWVNDPQGIAWETFRTLDVIPVYGEDVEPKSDDPNCCIPLAHSVDSSVCCVPSGVKESATNSCC